MRRRQVTGIPQTPVMMATVILVTATDAQATTMLPIPVDAIPELIMPVQVTVIPIQPPMA